MPTVLVTGANRGIGLEFVRQYAQDGWHVIACCRNPNAATKLQCLNSQFPQHLRVYALNMIDHVQIEQLSETLSTETIDLLINNAGVYSPEHGDAFGATDYAAWLYVFQVNSMAPLKMAEAFIQQIARSEFKTIVTITIYRASKAAVNIVMKSLSIDLDAQQINAVLLHPGWVKTDMGGASALISVEQSVTGMRHIIRNLTLKDSGKFYAFDGQTVPW